MEYGIKAILKALLRGTASKELIFQGTMNRIIQALRTIITSLLGPLEVHLQISVNQRKSVKPLCNLLELLYKKQIVEP